MARFFEPYGKSSRLQNERLIFASGVKLLATAALRTVPCRGAAKVRFNVERTVNLTEMLGRWVYLMDPVNQRMSFWEASQSRFMFFPQAAKHWGSNLRYREWESVTPVPGSCFPLVFLSPSLSGQMPDAVTLTPGSFPRLYPCVSQSLRSDARCCDAGSGVVSPACLPVFPVSAVGSGVVSPACLPVSPSLCQMLRRWP